MSLNIDVIFCAVTLMNFCHYTKMLGIILFNNVIKLSLLLLSKQKVDSVIVAFVSLQPLPVATLSCTY